MEFYRDVGLYIAEGDPGRLVVDGATSGVTLTSNEATRAPGDWTGLTIGYHDLRSSLTGMTLEYAGGGRAGLTLSQSSPTLTRCVVRAHRNHGVLVDTGAAPTITDSTLANNTADGLFVAARGALGGPFARNTLTGNGRYPASLPASQAHQLDASSTYTRNTTDRIALTGDAITRSVAWQRLDADYLVSGTVTVGATTAATLTVRDGVRAHFAAAAALNLGGANPGALRVEGTSTGVVFDSAATTPAAGDWSGVSLGASTAESNLVGLTLRHAGGNAFGALQLASPAPVVQRCRIESSGRNGIYVHSDSRPTITQTTVTESVGDGVFVSSAGGLATGDAPTFEGNTLSRNGQRPLSLPANFVGQLAANTRFEANAVERVRVTSDEVEQSATWRALAAPYLLAEGFSIQGSASPRATVEDGATLYAAPGVLVYVGERIGGTLVAAGSTAGVRFTSAAATPAAGDWAGLYFGTNARGSSLTRTTVEYGGTPASHGAVVVYQSDLEVTDSTLQDSAGYGLYLFTNGAATVRGTTIRRNALGGVYANDTSTLGRGAGGSFARNTITANGGPPLDMTARWLDELDASTRFTGNAADFVAVRGATLTRSATWRTLDVPYRFRNDVVVTPPTGTAVITVEAGGRYLFDRGADLTIADNAGLRVQGTSAARVTFTSSSTAPAAGDWLGLKLGNNCASREVDIAGLDLRYGGARTYGPGTAGAIWWIDCGGAIRDTTITDSATWGLFRIRATPTTAGLTYARNALGDLY